MKNESMHWIDSISWNTSYSTSLRIRYYLYIYYIFPYKNLTTFKSISHLGYYRANFVISRIFMFLFRGFLNELKDHIDRRCYVFWCNLPQSIGPLGAQSPHTNQPQFLNRHCSLRVFFLCWPWIRIHSPQDSFRECFVKISCHAFLKMRKILNLV